MATNYMQSFFLFLFVLIEAGSAISAKTAGLHFAANDPSKRQLPGRQAVQMGRLLAAHNFSLSMQFIQAEGRSAPLFSVYSNQGHQMLRLFSNLQSQKLELHLYETGGGQLTLESTQQIRLDNGQWHRLIVEVNSQSISLLIDCVRVIYHESMDEIDFNQLARGQPGFMIGQSKHDDDQLFVGTLNQFEVDRKSFLKKFCPNLPAPTSSTSVPFVRLNIGTQPGSTARGVTREPMRDYVTFDREKKEETERKQSTIVQPKPSALRENNNLLEPVNNDLHSQVKYLKHKVGYLENQFKQWRDVVRSYENQLKAVQLHQRGCQIGSLLLNNGDKWENTVNCTECWCSLGVSMCQSMGCPPLACSHPVHVKGQCCPQCRHEGLTCHYRGEEHQPDSVFWPKSCVRCVCDGTMGTVECNHQQETDCPPPPCPVSEQEIPPEECCPRCRDQDFCVQRPCDGNATCTNHKYDRECSCNEGFVGSGEQCLDVDECVWNELTGRRPAKCGKGASCVNLVGSYKCVCQPGYTRLADGSCLDTIV